MRMIIFFTFVLFPVLLFSQIQWEDNGVPVFCGENINWSGTVLDADDGNIVIIWSDSRNVDRGIFAQKITQNGTFLWGESGIEINDDPDTQIKAEAITSQNNEIIVAWTSHYGNFDMEVRVQKIDVSGNKLWQDEGVLLFTSNEILPFSIRIINDTVGGAFIVWKNNVHPNVGVGPEIVRASHVFSDGTIDNNWNVGGDILAQNPDFWNVLPDGNGSFIYAIQNSSDLSIQRLDSGGNPLWGDEGIVLCEDTVCGYSFASVTDNNEFFYFFWQDSRNANPNTIFMQKVDINGTTLFPEDLNIYSTDIELINIDAVYTSDNNLAMSWKESNYDQNLLKSLKLDTSGYQLFEPIIIYNNNNYCNKIEIISGSNDDYWIEWYVGLEGYFLQHINESGVLAFNSGLFICNPINYINNSAIRLTSDDKVFIGWLDEESSTNFLYAQIVDELGNFQFLDDGLVIHSGAAWEVSNLNIIPHENNPFFIWQNSGYHKQISVQSLNVNGTPVFEKNGIFVTNSHHIGGYDVDNQNNNFYIITKNFEFRAVAQSFDSYGNLLWNENGVFVTNSDNVQIFVQISIQDGFSYTGWTEYNGDFTNPEYNIYAQKIDENGNLLWDETGVLITDREGDNVINEILGRCYIWTNEDFPDYNIYAKQVDENGITSIDWDENGTPISEAVGNQNQPKGIQIPQGYLIIWLDNLEDDIYGQIITEEGNVLWQQDGLPLVVQPLDQNNVKVIYDEYIYLVWEDFRSGVDYEIYAQKFNENGQEIWMEGGVLIGEGTNPDIAKVSDRLIVVWEGNIDNNYNDIYAQLLGLNGDLLWNASGEVLCDVSWEQYEPQIVTDGIDDIYVG
ncbi:MAG: hypothetical protein K8S23_08000 [Candidatus Cloacimonetes bacterium]|nr:hypothetical protein [Candidatus Cloacimonadota bacterium]